MREVDLRAKVLSLRILANRPQNKALPIHDVLMDAAEVIEELTLELKRLASEHKVDREENGQNGAN